MVARAGDLLPNGPDLAVVVNCAGLFEILEQDRLDVERHVNLVGDDHAPAGEAVLPGDVEVVALDSRACLEPIRRIVPRFSSPSQKGLAHSPR